ncbi:MAG: sterol desaturase family protein [Sphingomonadales bacterium]|nr:sterol desaturase family protein [Sphingomonadales bacterium]
MPDFPSVQPDALRTIAFLTIFAVMAIWEAIAPLRRTGLPRRIRWSNNLALLLTGNLLLKLFFPVTAAGFAAWTELRGWGALNLVSWPDGAELVLALVMLDLAIYAQHRLFHIVPALWRLHRVHHTDTAFDLTTALRFHPLEIAVSMAIKLAAIALIGPSAAAVVLFEIVLNGAAMFNHGNVSLPARLERPLRWLVVTPDMHRIHHSTIIAETNSNYGFNLSCWDRLFASYTNKSSRPQTSMPLGLAECRSSRDAWLDRLLLQPFRRLPPPAGN